MVPVGSKNKKCKHYCSALIFRSPESLDFSTKEKMVFLFLFCLVFFHFIRRSVDQTELNQYPIKRHELNRGDHYSNLMLKAAKKSPERKCSACVVG